MALRSSLTVLLIVLVVESCYCRNSPQDSNLITQTCSKTPFPEICQSSLRTDPRGLTADLEGLAAIMVDVIKERATSTLERIKGMLGDNPTPALKACNDQYSVILTADVPQASKAVQTGNYKFALEAAEDAAVEADFCQSGYAGAPSSPLSDENGDMKAAALITTAIVKLLM